MPSGWMKLPNQSQRAKSGLDPATQPRNTKIIRFEKQVTYMKKERMKINGFVFLLSAFCVGVLLISNLAGISNGDSTGQLPIVSEKNPILNHEVENDVNKESTKTTVFVLYNQGKKMVGWGLKWFLNHNYSWGKGVNDFLKKFNEIIAMIISALVFVFEFWFNVIVYYLVGAIVAIYGAIAFLVGLILIPLIAIWNFILWLFSLL